MSSDTLIALGIEIGTYSEWEEVGLDHSLYINFKVDEQGRLLGLTDASTLVVDYGKGVFEIYEESNKEVAVPVKFNWEKLAELKK